MTARGSALMVGAVLLWSVGRLLGIAELYVVAVAAAALVAAGAFSVRAFTSAVSVRRGTTATRLLHGSIGEVHLDLRNDGRMVAPLLLVADDCHWTLADHPRFVVTGLRPGKEVELAYPIRGSQRGRYTVGPLRLQVRDPFGTTQITRRYEAIDEVLVYPIVEPLADGVTRGSHRGSGSSEARRLFNTGDEFHTMREYVTGDDLRMIHWRSTAHRQMLMVRQQEMPWQAEATILCDTRSAVHWGSGADSTFEKAVSVAASVAWHLADHRYQLRLVTDADVRSSGVQSWEEVLDRLAVIEPSRTRGLAATMNGLRGRSGEGLLVAVVAVPNGDGPVAQHPDVRALQRSGRGQGGRVAVVVHPARHSAGRAAECAALLRAAGWKATTVATGQRLADRWGGLVGGRARTAAFVPDAS